MKDLLERGIVFVRRAKSLLEKADGERRNCPRCRGSGLFRPRRIWQWDSRSLQNEPCWFCEGVGVMPLFGLNGFMLGRASAAIRTEKLREQVSPPVQMHLCSARYPGSKSTFSSYGPELALSSLLYNPASVPVWTADAGEELALQRSEDNETKRREVAKLEMPGHQEGSSPDTSSGHPSRMLLYNASGTRRLDTSGLKLRPFVGRRRDYPGGRLRIRLTREANPPLSAPVISKFEQKTFEGSSSLGSKGVREADQGLLSLASGAQLIPQMLSSSSSKRVKSVGVRRRRNQIREKMEKETIQNTWRLRRLLYAKPEQISSPESSGITDALQSFSGSWKDLSRKCLAELTASSRSPSKSRFSPLGPAVPYPSLVSQPLYKKLVGKLESLPSVALVV
ncbi:hypothetical protein R1flu_002999 [Riccia fluitans]|uniref:Uncharacterized protein n=1 Tax=Riccia fluitans TaxID=41844 RepID=A0ABD1Y8N7_9MARC